MDKISKKFIVQGKITERSVKTVQSNTWRKIVGFLAAGVGLWLGARYLLPVLMPFVMGGLLALAAEPAVRFGQRQLRLPRSVSAGLAVSLTLLLLAGVLSLLGAFAVKELGQLASALPDVGQTMRSGMLLLQDWTVSMAGKLPDGLRSLATDTALELFDGGSALVGQVTSRLPGLLSSVLGWLPGGALGLGTGILAGFMISARLPRLRQAASERLPESWREKFLPTLKQIKTNLGLWLKAQLKLTAVVYGIVCVGFVLLGISYGPFWALLVALVDAVPVLGTGTVLLPWALVALLRGQSLRAVGLLAVYAAALLSRTVLEPRLVGRQLGIDPLLTLLALYLGYQFWGIVGMLLAPMLLSAAKGITEAA